MPVSSARSRPPSFEDVQKAAGYRDPTTTKLYDRRGPFFATY
jgi:hypothetical protein